MKLEQLLQEMVDAKASDVFIIAGLPLAYSVSGRQVRLDSAPFKPADTEAFVGAIYEASGRNMDTFMQNGNHDDDFSFALPGIGASARRLPSARFVRSGHPRHPLRPARSGGIPHPRRGAAPGQVPEGARAGHRPGGAGKSTTLACIIDRLNHETFRPHHHDGRPIEYVHKHGTCIVTQREVPTDVATYSEALRSAMRESPDVILLGEMRDQDTIGTAVTAAEMAQLLFSTLHTTGAAGTVDRIIDAFPASQQRQIRIQLSMVLQAIVSQQLVPTVDGRHGAGLRDHDHEHSNPQPYSRGEDASAGQRHRLGRCRGHAHDGSELVRSREERTRSKRDGAAVQHPSRGA